MHHSIFKLALAAPLLWACGATIPPPTQKMSDAVAAERSARELGADHEPGAQLSLKLAQEQINAAKVSMSDGDNKRAEMLLVRAKADAELSIAQAREKGARIETQKAVDASKAQKETNVGQGAAK